MHYKAYSCASASCKPHVPVSTPDIGMKNNGFRRKVTGKNNHFVVVVAELVRNEKHRLHSCLQHSNTLLFIQTLHRKFFCFHCLCLSGTQKLCLSQYLEAFPTSGAWACPTLTSSHIATSWEHEESLLASPCSHIPQ